MTKKELDWADEEAIAVEMKLSGSTIPDRERIAHALRSAHRRGMEEAAGIVEAKAAEWEAEVLTYYDELQQRDTAVHVLKYRAAAIRAAIKNEEQPQEPTT